MMSKRFSIVFLCLCCLIALCSVALADTDGDFTYTVSGGAASVTGYTGSSASVVIPDTLGGNPVTIIAANAFKGNATLTSVVVPDGVTDLRGRAFYGCSNLVDVSLPDSLTSIATGAFTGCTSLKTLRLPQDVDTIGNNALPKDTLIIVESSDGMDTMAYDAVGTMCDCIEYYLSGSDATILRASTTADSMTVPDALDGHAVTSVAGGAFPASLKLIVDLKSSVAQTLCNYGYYVYDPSDLTIGVTISGGLITLAQYDGTASALTVPSFVEAIGDYAFQNNSTLTSVTLPASVTSIGYGAFYGTALESIDIPDGLTTVYSDSLPANCKPHVTLGSTASRALSNAGYTFYKPNDDIYGCQYIDGLLYLVLYNGSEDVVKVPEGIEGVAYVFGIYNKMTKVEFPSTLKVIGYEAFKNCSGLTSITIPSTVEEIGFEAFAGSALRSINLPDNVQRVGDSAFSGCTQLASATFVVSGKNGVSTIGSNAFYNTALRSVSIPTTTTSIGSGAFSQCEKLATVTLPANGSLNYIGSGAFSGSAITELTVPGTVERIDGSFSSCSQLKKVTLSSGVKVIGDSAFFNCQSLTEINVPSGVTTIGNSAFYYDSSLTKVALPNTVTSLGESAFAYAGLSGGVTLSSKLTAISASAFEYSQLTSVVLPNSVTSIGSNAFYGCSALTDVTLSNKLTSIAAGAFNECGSMTWFELPSTMTRLNQCLSGCKRAIVVLPDSITYIDGIALGDVRAVLGSRKNDLLKSLNRFGYSDEKSFIYTYIGDDGVEDFNTLRVVDYVGTASEATLPSDVKIINNEAFYNCTQLKKLTLPDKGIAKIGTGAFHPMLQVICTKGSDTYKLLVSGNYPVEVDGYPGLYAVSRDGKLYDASYRGNASIVDLPDNIAGTETYGDEYIWNDDWTVETIVTHDSFPMTTRYRTTFDSETANTLGSNGYHITVAGKEDFGFRWNYKPIREDFSKISWYEPDDQWFLAYYYGSEKTVVLPNDFSYFYLNDINAEVKFLPDTKIISIGEDYSIDLTYVGYEDYVFGYASDHYAFDGINGIYLKKYVGNSSVIVIGNDFPARFALENALPTNAKIYCEPALDGSFETIFANRSFFVQGYDDYELRYSGAVNIAYYGSDIYANAIYGPYLYKYTGTLKTITIDENFPVQYAIEGAIPSTVKVYCALDTASKHGELFYTHAFYAPDSDDYVFQYGDYTRSTNEITLISYTGKAMEATLPAGSYPIKSDAIPSSVKTLHIDNWIDVNDYAGNIWNGSIKLYAAVNSPAVSALCSYCPTGGIEHLYAPDYPDVEYGVYSGVLALVNYRGSDSTIHLPGYFSMYGDYLGQYYATGTNPFGKPIYTIANSRTAQMLDTMGIPYLTDAMTQAVLPAALTTIEEEAFVRCRFNEVTVPAKCTTIGARAFADSTDLIAIHIPKSVKTIDATAFTGCVQVTIYCKVGSAAEKFAQNNGIPYVNE